MDKRFICPICKNEFGQWTNAAGCDHRPPTQNDCLRIDVARLKSCLAASDDEIKRLTVELEKLKNK